MNAREFFDKVATMRRLQREYFKTRGKGALGRSKVIEREVDAEIERVSRMCGITNEPTQGNLFGNHQR